MAVANKAQGTPVETGTEDVRVGCWTFSSSGGSFSPVSASCSPTTNPPVNAVEVISRRRDTPIQVFFGKAIGFDKFSAAAIATAYRQSLSSPTPPPNELPNQIDGRIVLCPFDETAYPDTGTNCLELRTAGNQACVGTCTVKRLKGNQTITVGGNVVLQPGGGNVP